MFVQGDVLHLILANYWAPIDYRANFVVSDTEDDRLMPMNSLTNYGGHLDFEAYSAKWERLDGGLERLGQLNRLVENWKSWTSKCGPTPCLTQPLSL